jgi:hypothetical protein
MFADPSARRAPRGLGGEIRGVDRGIADPALLDAKILMDPRGLRRHDAFEFFIGDDLGRGVGARRENTH